MDDVIVIGGGPGGSTAASYLAVAGHKVTLFEKEKFPRDHVGESLLPYCYQLFQELGVLEDMIAHFVRKPGVRFIDVDGRGFTTWCFGHVIHDESYLSFHVRRAEFDQLLLENARRKGAAVFEETRVRQVEQKEDGTVEVTVSGPDNSPRTHQARFLIDASGRDTFLAGKMKTKQPHPNLDRSALSTHWRGAHYQAGMEEGLLQIVYLGGEKKGWIWVIPVGVDRLSVGVVLNHAYLREQTSRLKDRAEGDWRADLYHQEVFSSPFLRDVLADATTLMPVIFNGNYSYSTTQKHGDNWALVGDAASFIDPIFASGVYLAMNSARLVAGAVSHKLSLGDPANEGLRAVYETINGAYQLVDKAIQNFYNPATINWAQVGSAAHLIHKEHENALAIAHYLLAGDFFENHARYSRFLDLLADPHLFDMYKQNVIERPDFQSLSCGTDQALVFGRLLAEHE